MSVDIRLPIGGIFFLIGIILAVYGAVTGSDTELYARSLGHNINLLWGVVMLVFGGVMLFLARGSIIKPKSDKP